MSALRFVVDGHEYPMILADEMTFGEANVLQTAFKVDPLEIKQLPLTIAQTAALTWVAMHRVEESITPEQVMEMQMLTVGLVGTDELADQEPAEGEAAAAGANGGKRNRRSSARTRAASGSRG